MSNLVAVYTDTHKGRVNFFVVESVRFAYAIINSEDGEVGFVSESHEMSKKLRARLEDSTRVSHYIRPLRYR